MDSIASRPSDEGDGNASVNNLFAAEGGMFPKGALVMILVLNAVIFAYNGIELVGITAGEMQNPAKEVPKAIRAVVFRIVVESQVPGNTGKPVQVGELRSVSAPFRLAREVAPALTVRKTAITRLTQRGYVIDINA